MPKSKHRQKKQRYKIPKSKKPDELQADINSILTYRPENSGRVEHIIVPNPPTNSPQAKIPRSPHGSAGIYLITFVLCVPGQKLFQDNLNFPKLRNSGDSLLYLPQGIKQIDIHVSATQGVAQIVLMKNKNGAISHAITRIHAKNFKDAESKAHEIVIPALSQLSFKFDVAMEITGFEVLEEKTKTTLYSYGMLGKPKLFNNLENFSLQEEYKRFFSAYREGLNSTNIFYQALSFYKIIGGILARRIRQKKATKSYVNGEKGFLSTESFPKNLKEIPQSKDSSVGEISIHLGKSFEDVYDYYRNLIRNAIAHLEQLEGILDADNFEDISTCEKAAPVLKFIARQMMSNDLEKLSKDKENYN